MNHSKEHHSQLFGVLSRLDLVDVRDGLVKQITQGKKEHTSDLTDPEVMELIGLLSGNDSADRFYGYFDKNNQQHQYILSLCFEIGWITRNGSRNIPDIVRLGAWLRSDKSKIRKPLKLQTSNDLHITISQLESISSKKYRSK